MKKIFKYIYNPETKTVRMPFEADILRIDFVNDSFYKGNFLWAIVDAEAQSFCQEVDMGFPYSLAAKLDKSKMVRRELAVKEKQEVLLAGEPIAASEDDGKLYVYYHPDGSGQEKKYCISFYKTGQEINEDLSSAVYLGVCRLWIVMELGLYTFWTNANEN